MRGLGRSSIRVMPSVTSGTYSPGLLMDALLTQRASGVHFTRTGSPDNCTNFAKVSEKTGKEKTGKGVRNRFHLSELPERFLTPFSLPALRLQCPGRGTWERSCAAPLATNPGGWRC